MLGKYSGYTYIHMSNILTEFLFISSILRKIPIICLGVSGFMIQKMHNKILLINPKEKQHILN